MDPYRNNSAGFTGHELKKAIWAVAVVLGIGMNGCSQPQIIDDDKVRAVVDEVMKDQSTPVSKTSIINEMDRQKGSLFDDHGEKSELKAMTMHRLADLYLMLEDRVYRQNFQRYNQQFGMIQRGNQDQNKPALPNIEHARSRSIYEKLLTLYPDRPENDRVLYQLAHIYDDEGDIEKSMSFLKQLVDHYPNSPSYGEALFRLAEAYYDSNEYEKAQTAYQKVINLDNTEFSEEALYKLGWIYFSVQDYPKAVTEFTRLMDRKRLQKGKGGLKQDAPGMSTPEWDQVMEVVRSIALSFSYLGPPSRIQDFYEKSGHKDYEYLIYRKLGDLYLAQKRVQDAVGAYEAFIKAYPYHEDAPIVQMEIIDAYQHLDLVDLSNQARIVFAERFGEDSLWYQKATPKSRQRVRPFYRQLINQLALFYHSEAQQTRRPQDYEKALTWYRRYLKAFPKDPDSPRVNFLMAETLFELQRYPEAVDEYEHSAYDYALHQDSAESGYAVIVTLEKIRAQNRQDSKTRPLEVRLGANCKRFAEAFPNDSRVADVLWKGTEIYYRLGNLGQTRTLAEMIVKASSPTDEAGFKAQRLIANSYFEEHSYEQAASAYRKLVRMKEKGEVDQEARRLWASSLYKQAEEFKAAGKLREAQTEFMRVQAEVPGSEIAPVALFDGASVALLRNQLDEALQLFQIQVQRYPVHALNQKIPDVLLQVERTLLAAGKIQEAQALTEKVKVIKNPSTTDLSFHSERLLADRYFEGRTYEQAAAAYRKLAEEAVSLKNPDQEELRRLWASALYKQAEGLKKAGKPLEAQTAFLRVQTEVPGSEIAPVALFDAGGIAVVRGDAEGAVRAYKLLLQQYPVSTFAAPASIQVAKVYEGQGHLREAAQQYESVVKLSQDRKTNGEVLLAAGRLYEQLEDWVKVGAIDEIYLGQYPGDYDQIVETTFKLALAKRKLGLREEAQQTLQTLIDRYGRTSTAGTPSAYYVAKAYLFNADDLLLEFDGIKLVSPLEQNLEKKKKLLKNVLEEYARATEFDVADVTTAATQKIGMVFEKFRTALLESERPQGLTPQQLEQYNFLLEEQAYPYEEKAIAAYESNVHRAQQLGLYDPWIRQSYDDLARLMPARYRKKELDEIVRPEVVASP